MARHTRKKKKAPKQVEALKHDESSRKNIPTAELQSAAQRAEEIAPVAPVAYARQTPLAEGQTRERNEDVDPQIIWQGTRIHLTPKQLNVLNETGAVDIGEAQLVWRGKDRQDWSDLVVQAPPLYIQEHVHPKAIIDDLKRRTGETREAETDAPDLFADFGTGDLEARTEFYAHDQNWTNRMILGDSLQVMASLAERESLRGQVQCIYFDPPYGIRFGSNWQVSTRSRDVKDGKLDQITREPEQVKAFRDTWADGIHSYLTYLRDRLTAMRDLLTESGSIFVQIGDENVHRVRALMDEVFGEENFVAQITFRVKSPLAVSDLARTTDFILWYAKNKSDLKFRQPRVPKNLDTHPEFSMALTPDGEVLSKSASRQQDVQALRYFTAQNLASSGYTPSCMFQYEIAGRKFDCPRGKSWKTTPEGMRRLHRAGRLQPQTTSLRWRYFFDDAATEVVTDVWSDTFAAPDKTYVVQTSETAIQRCILMTTDPGDLVFDPTCGSGTTAYVAEQWGRRWITIDTSRVALALARARLMGTRYPYYHLADSPAGREKEQEVSGRIQPDGPTHGDIRQGFVYERAPHVTLKSIANNAEIDVIWETWQETLEPLRDTLNKELGETWEEWEIPREADEAWNAKAKEFHADWWEARIKRQEEIDASIAQKADVEYLYDRPYVDNAKVRVAGPFTVESLSPHRTLPADSDELIGPSDAADGARSRQDAPLNDFTRMVIDNLLAAGVQQSAREDRIAFTAITGWPGEFVAAEGTYLDGATEKRAAIFIGPEFGTVTRADLTAAAREANDARFDTLIACGFNFDAHTSELSKLGPLPILKAKMNPDLHMSEELKNTGSGNLFIVFGEPDIEWETDDDGRIVVTVLGVDVFDTRSGDVRSSGTDEIAAWFIDTDYNEESFFVRHAYFLGAQDPYKSLKTSLKAEIDTEAWETLYRDTSRPFDKPSTGRFAVKVINHFGDEVMKVFGV